ncbi:GNAT family N-acetyltransferase [Paenibacillus sp. YAF4_2]|uniref:GNAT family N-acetyltransferase n=1 Tax=Paenibacillus sp. YAF4_2 TaxID=3233085 RepID=UPI003F9D45AC
MTQYRMGKPEERDEIVDLANYAFGIDFEKILPKVYHENDQSYEITMVAENKEGKLVSQIALLPQALHVGTHELRAKFLGGVAVHPRARGEGHMKVLMTRWLDEMRGTSDISILSGQRQRYEYFGYTAGGIKCEYTITRANVRHVMENIDSRGISFLPLFELENAEAFASTINTSRLAYIPREPRLIQKIFASFGQAPIGIVCEDTLIGYLVKDHSGTVISELSVTSAEDIRKIMKAYFDTYAIDQVRISLPEYEMESNAVLSVFAENYKTEASNMYNIFDFANVLEAYLTLKFHTIGLSPGVFSAIMDDQPVTIRVDQSGVHVEREAWPEAVVLDKMEAQKLILTPFGRYMDVAAPKDWFPLPIFWYLVDCF